VSVDRRFEERASQQYQAQKSVVFVTFIWAGSSCNPALSQTFVTMTTSSPHTATQLTSARRYQCGRMYAEFLEKNRLFARIWVSMHFSTATSRYGGSRHCGQLNPLAVGLAFDINYRAKIVSRSAFFGVSASIRALPRSVNLAALLD